jgi:ureidoacrylate peracid hydrolase
VSAHDGLALLMIDLQNMYVSDDGSRAARGWPPIWRLAEVVEECRLLAESARSMGIPVVYTRAVARPDGADAIPSRAKLAAVRGLAALPVDAEHADWKSRIMDEVAPVDGDIVIDKLRPSLYEFTPAEAILMNLGVTRLVIAGLQTNVCVEATVRSALAHNYEVGVAQDAVTTDGPDLHHGALNSMRVLYAEVAPWRELMSAGVPWDRAVTTPNYGRNPSYWDETAVDRDETSA